MTRHDRSTADARRVTAVTDLMSSYVRVWERQARAFNDVWTDCTRDGATVSDWPKGWNKLLMTWTDSVQDLCESVMSSAASNVAGSTPLITFVIDRSAESDAGRHSVALPPNVDPKNLVATPLVALNLDGHPVLDGGIIQLLSVPGSVEIGIAVPAVRPAPGHYLSIVCEPKAGAPVGHPLTNSQDPPPRAVIAVVLVLFI